MDKGIPKVFVKEEYEQYLNGTEVTATANSTDNIFEGDHVLVFRNSIPAHTSVAVPREKQADYIGVEGIVTKLIDRIYTDDHLEPKKQMLAVKII
jgi:hypothetical protein